MKLGKELPGQAADAVHRGAVLCSAGAHQQLQRGLLLPLWR